MLPIEIGCGKIWKTPRGPKGDSRGANVIGSAVKVTRVAMGKETECAGQRGASRLQASGAIDILIGLNKSVYFGKNVLIVPPPLLGHVCAILDDARARLDIVESCDCRCPVFAECRDLVIVLSHVEPHALQQAFP
jgi:hypothetical protein